jgi:hemoglobin/transferrin/lactoferrin receptor protein
MKRILLMLLGVCIAQAYTPVYAQKWTSTDSTKVHSAGEVVISANRVEEAKANVPQQIQVIRASAIRTINAPTTAELLSGMGGVNVQKSQQGGGSPMIRGFEANRVMLVIDGVRLNNIIFRGGHLQNVIAIDQSVLDRVEVLFGPASAVYGSDALGGVVHFVTRKPELAVIPADRKDTIKTLNVLNVNGNAFMRYATANQEKTAHADVNFGTRKVGFLSSFSMSTFGDLRQGANRDAKYATFGLRNSYVVRENGVDVLKTNDNPNVQLQSGYTQYDVVQKIRLKPSDRFTNDLNFQYSTSTDVPRYDRLTDPDGKGGLKNSQWYYGPQTRLLASYDGNIEKVGMFDNLHINLNTQSVEESRHQRKFGSTALQHRIENVQTFGYRVELRKQTTKNDIRFGIDGQRDDLKSTANAENVSTGAISALDTRYPDGTNKMGHDALFVTHRFTPSSKLILSEGLRAFRSNLHSTFVNQAFFKFPFTEISQESSGLSGNLGLILKPTQAFRVASVVSTGYRSPNVDDLAKIFETVKGTLIVPNPDLKPEKTVSLDLNLGLNLANLEIEQVFFKTWIRDAIVTDKFQFNGQSQILYDGTLSQVYANQNKREAYIQGATTNMKAFIGSELTLDGTMTYTYGRVVGTSGETPLDHIPPFYGRLGVAYRKAKHSAQFYTLFNGKKDIKDYLLNAEDNEAYATADGMPAWWTLNLRYELKLRPNMSLQLGMENILDQNYRVFASGISAPGRNLSIAFRTGF